jgi:hypothetical protein
VDRVGRWLDKLKGSRIDQIPRLPGRHRFKFLRSLAQYFDGFLQVIVSNFCAPNECGNRFKFGVVIKDLEASYSTSGTIRLMDPDRRTTIFPTTTRHPVRNFPTARTVWPARPRGFGPSSVSLVGVLFSDNEFYCRNRIARISKAEDLVTVKAALLKAGVVALGIGLGLGIVILAAVAYTMVPKGWDKKAITASFDSVDFNRSPSPAVYYTYSLSNNTDQDFSTELLGDKHLPENLRAAAKHGPVYDNATLMPKSAPSPVLRFGDINCS